MNAFDKVIGYKATKRELLQLCDMLRNREIYEEMGARLPHGLLLYGDPGLGKTLLARCFVEESGLHTITVRRNKGATPLSMELHRPLPAQRQKRRPLSFWTTWTNLPTRMIPTATHRNMPPCKQGSTM